MGNRGSASYPVTPTSLVHIWSSLLEQTHWMWVTITVKLFLQLVWKHQSIAGHEIALESQSLWNHLIYILYNNSIVGLGTAFGERSDIKEIWYTLVSTKISSLKLLVYYMVNIFFHYAIKGVCHKMEVEKREMMMAKLKSRGLVHTIFWWCRIDRDQYTCTNLDLLESETHDTVNLLLTDIQEQTWHVLGTGQQHACN